VELEGRINAGEVELARIEKVVARQERQLAAAKRRAGAPGSPAGSARSRDSEQSAERAGDVKRLQAQVAKLRSGATRRAEQKEKAVRAAEREVRSTRARAGGALLRASASTARWIPLSCSRRPRAPLHSHRLSVASPVLRRHRSSTRSTPPPSLSQGRAAGVALATEEHRAQLDREVRRHRAAEAQLREELDALRAKARGAAEKKKRSAEGARQLVLERKTAHAHAAAVNDGDLGLAAALIAEAQLQVRAHFFCLLRSFVCSPILLFASAGSAPDARGRARGARGRERSDRSRTVRARAE
jgi:hypothetical protein